MKLFTATAIVALVTAVTPALAETMMDKENLIRTRDITGGEIYRFNVELEDTTWDGVQNYDTVDTNWNDIGEIEDIILDRNGQMVGIVAEVGGFLDIADKHVMIPLNDVRLVATDDKTYGFVTRLSEEQIEAMDAVDEGWWN